MSLQTAVSFPFPWGEGVADFVESIQTRVKSKSMVLTVTSPLGVCRAVMMDGIRVKDRQQWTCDPHNLPLPAKHHHLIVTSEVRMPGSAMWTLAVSRLRPEFGQDDLMQASVCLNQCRAGFDIPEDSRMGRVLSTEQGQCLDADPRTLYQLSTRQDAWQQLFEKIMQVHAQRWPQLPQDSTQGRDIVLDWQGVPTWIRSYYLYDMMCLELRQVEPEDVPVVGLVEDSRVARALGFLDDHYMAPPSLDEVAAHVEVSAFHFHRLFSTQVGISPKNYCLRKQIQIAKWLLRNSLKPIATIAEHTGFASHGHFTATFHRMVGCSPRDYREQVSN